MKITSVTPPNSLVLVMDGSIGRVPDTMAGCALSSTESCLAVGCRSEHDGPTELRLGSMEEVMPMDELVFDGELATPSGRLSVFTIMYVELISVSVAKNKTRLKVYTNHMTEPDRISIYVA